MRADQIWQMLDGSMNSGEPVNAVQVLTAVLLSLVLGQVLAWTYFFTHSGLSYSKSFVQSLVLITVVIALVMSTIQNSFVTAVGLLGALSIIRFRNMIKDTRDIAFIFGALMIGMAAGSRRYDISIIGTIAFAGIAAYMHVGEFGAHRPHNGFLRFSLDGHMGADHPVGQVLKKFCRNFTLISAQDSDFDAPTVEYAYQVMIKNTGKNAEMLAQLEELESVSNVSLTMQEQLLEV
ncbi:hypothetical protein STSP2_01033 [Anaerohalosphaera lusitana]|uniref:DUF4956 domain-containing protein n=1 Tax=Anaerohalosphaera lusitana TaxID=1936003 RepID=A0A1U9NIY2_9BACT|nr:DUF4956 domain-containing protein [Anaerohalosphaera lusitana]AQT67881.1 hypothetical protein STSP2_01033 [Anaerohalosphaera lusitana]